MRQTRIFHGSLMEIILVLRVVKGLTGGYVKQLWTTERMSFEARTKMRMNYDCD